MKRLILLCSCLFIFISSHAAKKNIEQILKKKLPNAQIKKLETKDHFNAVFEIMIEQPLDHKDKSAGTFQQRLFLYHKDVKAPMVFVTEGYAARDRTYELSRMLNSNQLIVEYRFFGASVADSINWSYLKNDQAIEDLHRLNKIFKKIYKKKWVSTGISKGGTTTMIYKSKYPKDVKVAVPYVAPLALAQEDERTDKHIKNMGSVACKEKLFDFQKMVLERKKELLPMLEAQAKKDIMKYSIGFERALEFAALEFTFSFWQWGSKCEEVPGREATTDAIFTYLDKVVSFSFYSDATYEYYKPAFYQFMTELGYYGFITDHVADLLTQKEYSNRTFGPLNADLAYKPYLQPVVDYLDKKGKRVLLIYGAIDPWTSCGYQPKEGTDMLRMDLEGGSHFTRIGNFSRADQEKIRKQLNEWLKVKVELP